MAMATSARPWLDVDTTERGGVHSRVHGSGGPRGGEVAATREGGHTRGHGKQRPAAQGRMSRAPSMANSGRWASTVAPNSTGKRENRWMAHSGASWRSRKCLGRTEEVPEQRHNDGGR